MTIRYHTTRPDVHDVAFGRNSRPEDQTLIQNRINGVEPGTMDGVVGSGRATTDSLTGAMPGDSTTMTTKVRVQGGQKMIQAEMTGLERQVGEAKEIDDHTMTAWATDTFKEVRDNQANSIHTTDLGEKAGKETAHPVAAERGCTESNETIYEKVPVGPSVTMTRPLLQLVKSVEIEKQRLDDFEKDLEKAISARLEIQSLSTPRTARNLESRMIETEHDIAAIQWVVKMRQRLVEREARLAHVGVELHDRPAPDNQGAQYERREVEAEKRHNVKVEGLERMEKLEKEERVRPEVQGTTQTTQESDRGLISLLADNDRDIATAYEIIRTGRTLTEWGEDLQLLEIRVARRNWQIVNAHFSDSTVDLRRGDRPSLDDYQKRFDETRRLRLMIYRHLREYIQSNGTAAASSLLRALSKLPLCTPSHMRLKNALISSIQQHDAETGSRYEGPGYGGVRGFAPAPVSQEEYLMHYLPRYSTNHPMCSYNLGSTTFLDGVLCPAGRRIP